jgi:acetylornithine aminotransferase
VEHILACHDLVKTDFVRGEGSFLYDAGGRRYVDFEAGIWCAGLGHGHPRVNAAMREQIERLVHLSHRYTNALAEEAAIDVLDTLAHRDGKCVFLSSGSEAVEFAVQAARRVTGKPLFLALEGSYLSAYGSSGGMREEEWSLFDWKACASCRRADACGPDCPHLRGVPFDRIGALVFEGGHLRGTVRILPQRLVDALVRGVREAGGLLVANEVTAGLGRTGAWYGFEHYALRPEVVALGKGLGNGYPVSAVALSRDVAGRLEASGLRYAQSHQNDPLGCAVAREVIAVLREEGLVERAREVGGRFMDELRGLAARRDDIREVRGRGLMIAVEFERGEGRPSTHDLQRDLLERGFLVGANAEANVLRFYPPLVIGEEEIASLLENLDEILEVS